jgi:hypothetical protein
MYVTPSLSATQKQLLITSIYIELIIQGLAETVMTSQQALMLFSSFNLKFLYILKLSLFFFKFSTIIFSVLFFKSCLRSMLVSFFKFKNALISQTITPPAASPGVYIYVYIILYYTHSYRNDRFKFRILNIFINIYIYIYIYIPVSRI